jgi:spore germination protein KC
MKKYKFGLLVFIIILQPIAFCGCWNSREIDTLAIVAGMAIDKDQNSNKYIVTVEVVFTESQGNNTTFGSELYSAKGDTLFEAIRNIIEETGLKLYWCDAKIVIISQELARKGIIPLVDWPIRDSETRSDMWLLISKDHTAAEILKYKVKLNRVVSFHLDDTMNSEKTISKYTESRMLSFIEKISTASNAATIATVKIEPTDSTNAAKINGCAFFKYDKLAGFLDGNETLYMHVIENKINEGVVILKNVANSGTNITMEIFGNKTKLTPTYDMGNLAMEIDVQPVLEIAEVGGSENFMEETNLKKLQLEIEKKIKVEMSNLISKMQFRYGIDIFGFENKVKNSMPQIYDKLKRNGEEIFKTMSIKISVNVKIKGSGIMSKAISKQEQ